jgi:monovalent cation:H+ antiporter, CPA1 family
MGLSFQMGALLLLVAGVVAIISRRLRLPYSVGLVTAGIVLGLVPFSPKIALTKELLYTVLLPPLIFEGALYLDWRQLRRELPVVLTLATAGVVLSAGATGIGMHYLAGWPWLSAVVFGVLIAATDPVSVIATFKEAKAHGRLLLLVESESLLNDGTAALLLAIVLEVALGGFLTPSQLGIRLIVMVGGSLFCGGLVAGVVLLLAGRADDHLVEITFTTVAAYGSFVLAERFQVSGVLATLTAGLVVGNVGRLGAISDRGREAVQAFWEYAAFVANSFVFLLIGMREASQNFVTQWPSVAAAIVLVLLARALAVYGCCGLFAGSARRVTLRHQHVLFWGGLRGALALALALALPPEMPRRESIVTASFAVVAFSVFAQGLSLTPLLRYFGEIPARAEWAQTRGASH